jgi:Peptidase family M28/WD40-like Beta Propeller Repeat
MFSPHESSRGLISMRIPRTLFGLALLLAAPVGTRAQQPLRAAFDSAYLDWDAGRYPDALAGLRRILSAPGGDAMIEPIALLTGELYTSTEITTDGAAPRWSLDGRLIAYETGSGGAQRTMIVALDGAMPKTLAEISGRGLVLSADGSRAAYFTDRETPELKAARSELVLLQAASDRAAMVRQQQEIRRLEMETARIVVRDLASGRETDINAPGITRGALAFGDDGQLYLAGTTPGQETRPAAGGGRGGRGGFGAAPLGDRLVRLTGAGAPATAVSSGPIAGITSVRALPGHRILLETGRGGFATVDLASGASRSVEGGSPSPSANGRWVVFLSGNGVETTVNLVSTDGRSEPRLVVRPGMPLANPAVSPDGSRIAWSGTPREDAEIYIANADGSGETRLTREIQHDIAPQFLSNDRLLGLIGEPRHRRSYLYDIGMASQSEGAGEAAAAAILPGTPGRVRLHHNNRVRTVAPEYDWASSPDGSKVLIVADRDGNTISPERGLYLMDLKRTVAKPELVRRLDAQLAEETALRENGARLFAPIRPAVADAVARVSTTHIYNYANDVFQFDSKFVSQPGNAKAIAYYTAKLREFGYEPELQWFEPANRPGVRTANIVARLPGTVDPDLVYAASSHFDSVERGPGADDDSSGATALLEAARALAGHPQAATIEFAFFTGEEAGLLGSREFVRRAVESGKKIVGALNNDMVGFRNDNRWDNTIRYSNAGIRDIQHAAAFLFTGLITYDAKYYRSTDAAAYYEAWGDIVGGIGSYPILGSPHYHQTHDVLETIDQNQVAEVSKTTVATLMLLASSPSRLTDLTVTRSGRAYTATWKPAVESNVGEYIVSWGAPSNPTEHTMRVNRATAGLDGATPGDIVMVKGVNGRGMESWDWAQEIIRR